MKPNGLRHSELLEEQVVCWFFVGLGLVGLFILAFLFQGISHWSASDNHNEVKQERELWQMVSGRTEPDITTRAGKYAADFRAKLGAVDPQATALPAAFDSIVGTDPNYYDLFNDGKYGDDKLTADARQKLLLIKQGKTDLLLHNIGPVPPNKHGYTYTPFGLSILETLVLIWLIGGPGVLIAARVRLSDKNPAEAYQYRLINLSWELDGDHTAAKLGNLILPVTAVGPYLLARRLRNRSAEHHLERDYPEQMKVVHRLTGAIHLLLRKGGAENEASAARLQQLRENLLQSLTGIGDITAIQDEAVQALSKIRLQQDIVRELNGELPTQ